MFGRVSSKSTVSPLLPHPRPAAPCGYNVTSQNGTIYSPGFPDEYPILKDCVWLVTVPPGHGVYINFSLLQTEAVNDYIAVWYETVPRASRWPWP